MPQTTTIETLTVTRPLKVSLKGIFFLLQAEINHKFLY